MTLYRGSTKIRDTGSYGVYHGNTPIAAIYKGSQRVYFFQNKLTWSAGTTLAAYKVPSYISKISVDCVASRGGGNGTNGKGGRVQCVLSVSPGTTLYITVGGIATNTYVYNAADIRTNNAGLTDNSSLQSRLIVAGGGGYGSANASYNAAGGDGGGLTGAAGLNSNYGAGGKGGTQTGGGAGGSASGTAGGIGGWSGKAGSFGVGGVSNDWNQSGGSGWYGGGGGGASAYFGDGRGGGGGGSSYTNSSLCTNVVHTQGYQNGAGYITITEIG